MQSFKHATKRHNQLSLWLVIENTWRAARVVCFCTTQRRRPLGALHVAKTPAQEACMPVGVVRHQSVTLGLGYSSYPTIAAVILAK